MKKALFWTVSCLIFVGCARTMMVYPRDGGQASKGKVHVDTSTLEGEMELNSPDGEHFTGRYIASPDTSGVGWGLVNAYGSGGAFASGSNVGYGQSLIGSARAILTGDKGRTMRCEVRYNADYHGFGICQCSDEKIFDVQF